MATTNQIRAIHAIANLQNAYLMKNCVVDFRFSDWKIYRWSKTTQTWK